MSALSRFIRFETHHGRPIQAGEATITPISRARLVDLGRLGFVWNRPVAVLVERGERRERLPIFDPTGLMLAGIAALIITATAFSVLSRRNR
jgi:hypothetical protein